ncbi:MAG: PKD domain-containing protein [Verrucomicrobiales bacterium]|nr:PKD domain-containing protein [Verrucomicrobiales bacterium]
MKRGFGSMAWRLGIVALLTTTTWGAVPVVKTVPWVAGNALIPHTTYAGRSVTMKGTCDRSGGNLQWTWDFGDGSPLASGAITDAYVIQATHAYTGPVGTVYTARLTVTDTVTGETGSKPYYVQMRDKTLEIEVNVAIDEGLWYLHSTQVRRTEAGVALGDWTGGGAASSGWNAVSVANLNAFQVNGHLENGSADNPYTETVQRGMRRLFQWLAVRGIGRIDNGVGSNLNPDSNGNGIGLFVGQGYSYYQGGMFMDAIVASSTPNAVATTGSDGVVGRTYAAILQDMVDDHAWAQYDGSPGGGWRYSANEYPDNSACQWAAIGLIAAERNWGLVVPSWVKQWNVPWLAATQNGDGSFGYTSPQSVWGPYATTPSGLVQMVLDGIGRDMGGGSRPNWNAAETFVRDNFGASGGAWAAIKDYYYGLFSFVKSMLLHRTDTDGDGVVEPVPITLLRSSTPGVLPLDWYSAEVSRGDPTDGVARTLVNDQNPSGYWYGHNYSGDQYPFETAWAIMMLHRTLFESGVPVAVAKAIPNPGIVGQTIALDGSDSYHQDPARSIVKWEWDANSDGTFESSGPTVNTSFGALGDFPVRLRVTDDNTIAKTVETTILVRINRPPLAPTADADGPYVFCGSWTPWRLDGRRSMNPDEGGSEPHDPPYPGDTIDEYTWDLDGDGVFGDVTGSNPDVTAYFRALGPGNYLVYLKVTDKTGSSYPSSPLGDLSDTATAQVFVLPDNDPGCACVTITADPVVKGVELDWTADPSVASYNVYRGTTKDGPYHWVGSVTAPPYVDKPGILNATYYYVVRSAALNGDELCQSNEVMAEPLHPVPSAFVTSAKVSNLKRYYWTLSATSPSFGRMQLLMYVGDTASSLVVGPIPNSSIVYIRTGMPAASERPGPGLVSHLILLQGSARVWAQDPIGQKSTEVVIP